MSSPSIGSLAPPSAPIVTAFVGGSPLPSGVNFNFNAEDFVLTLVNNKLDVVLSKILHTGEVWKYEDAAQTGQGGLGELIWFDGSYIAIGQNSQTVPRGVKLHAGQSGSVFQVNGNDLGADAGKTRLGGVNKRIQFDETGLTALRNYTFPDWGGRMVTRVLETGDTLQYRDTGDVAHSGTPNLISFDGSDIIFGENTQTSGFRSGVKILAGLSASVFQVVQGDDATNGGKTRLGGVNKSIMFDEGGLNQLTNYQFPNRSGGTQVLGVLDSPPMGYTDYSSGSIVGQHPDTVDGTGLLKSLVTYGTSFNAGLSNSAHFRTYQTGTVVDTLAGERSNYNVTRYLLNPILFGRIHMNVANTDVRWFFGLSDLSDMPVNTDEPLANASGVGIVIDDGVTDNELEFHINNGAATATKVNIMAAGITALDDTWNYYVIDCNDTDSIDTITAYTWIGGVDGTPRDITGGVTEGPTTTDIHTAATTKLGEGTSLKYHNVINNDSTTNKVLNIAEIHLVNRPTLDNVDRLW